MRVHWPMSVRLICWNTWMLLLYLDYILHRWVFMVLTAEQPVLCWLVDTLRCYCYTMIAQVSVHRCIVLLTELHVIGWLVDTLRCYCYTLIAQVSVYRCIVLLTEPHVIGYLLYVMATDNHSRVILDVTNGSLESDYINASYIDVRIKFTDWLFGSRFQASLFGSLVVLRCELGTWVCVYISCQKFCIVTPLCRHAYYYYCCYCYCYCYYYYYYYYY